MDCSYFLCIWYNFVAGCGSILDSSVFAIVLAMVIALVLMCNLYSGFMLCQIDEGDRVNSAPGARRSARAPTNATNFDYGPIHGPHTWDTAENNQSPINISSRSACRISLEIPLMWRDYDCLPNGIRLENNGYTLVLRASFSDQVPCIEGADLLGAFDFYEIVFRWSWYNNSGSEHTIDNVHFPLEMQCIHSSEVQQNGQTSSRSLVFISYMFELSDDNPFLDVLVQHLVAVQQAGQCVEVPPFPLSYLMPAFYTNFYSYEGSSTAPPCHRGVEWLVNPIPLAIGERQLNEFRQLRGPTGARISNNARPVQELCNRAVYFNRFSN